MSAVTARGARVARKRGAIVDTGSVRTDWLLTAAQLVLGLRIVLVLLIFDPRASDTFTLPKSAASHTLSVLLAGLLVAVVVRDRSAAIRWSPLHGAVIGTIVASALAVPFALDQTVAIFGAWRRYLGLTQLLDYGTLYFAAAMLLRNAADLRRLLAVCGAASGLVLAYGVAQRLGLDPLQFNVSATQQPVGTLGQPDFLAAYAAIVVSTAAAVVIFRWIALTTVGRAALGALVLLGLAVIYIEGARNAVLGLGGGLLAVALLQYLRPLQARASRIVPIILLVALAGVVVVSPVGQRLTASTLAVDPSLQSRLEIWSTALRLVATHPIIGLGPDNFAVAYPSARSERSELVAAGELQTSTHDWLLHYATGGGLLVAAPLLAALALGVVRGVQLTRRANLSALGLVPLAAFMGQALVNVNDVSLEWVFWLSLGVIATEGVTAGRAASRPNRGPYAIVLGALALFVWIGSGEIGRLGASQALAVTDALVANGNGLAAVDSARRSLTLDGHRAEYHGTFGVALNAAGNPNAAATAFLEAAAMYPYQALYWRDAAVAKLSSGDESSGIALLERAVHIEPLDVKSAQLLAILSFNRGDYVRAIEEGELTARLRPDDPAMYEAAAQAHIKLGHWTEAEALLRVALQHAPTAHLHVLLARVYLATTRLDLASAQVSEALVLDPESAEALQLRAALHP